MSLERLASSGKRTTGRGRARRLHRPSAPRPFERWAFTLIEVLIVVVVIGVLVSALGIVGMKALRGNKVRQTQSIMSNVRIAIDQFAREAPLASIYNRPTGPTFGPLPPYMLANHTIGVSATIEPNPGFPGPDYVLANRLHRDLASNPQSSVSNYVYLTANDQRNDDIRALYAYLRVYSPGIVSQIPQSALRPLGTTAEYVNPAGNGTNPGAIGLVDVLGIHDAWGVPLDYYLHVKLEPQFDARAGAAVWRVTDRVPVLRSLGIDREEYDSKVGAGVAFDSSSWIFSEPFPSPPCGAAGVGGDLVAPAQNLSGWARAVPQGDLRTGEPHAFGFVP